MDRLLADILADHRISDAELSALIANFDTNGDGRLEGEEVWQFARAVADLMRNDLGDVYEILSFFQADDDPALDREELRTFLEIQLA